MSSFCASPVTISTGVKKTFSCKLLYFPSFFCRSISRSSTRRILPEMVLGRVSTNSMKNRLSLTIAIANGHARYFFPSLNHLRVERLTGANTVSQRPGWVRLEVDYWLIEYEHTVGGWWRAARRYGILVEHLQRLDGIEFAACVLYKHRCAHDPWSKQIAPRSLCPAQIPQLIFHRKKASVTSTVICENGYRPHN